MEKSAGLLRKIQEIESIQTSNAQQEKAKQNALDMLKKAELDYMGDMSTEAYKQGELDKRNKRDNDNRIEIQKLKNKQKK